MSVQSDMELLILQTMETYSYKKNMDMKEVISLFHEHQVNEKFIMQHEYLHQIPFEEVLEYTEEILNADLKELIVYHGTTFEFEQIDLNRSHNRRDFGKGFYTTILEQQAKEWGYRLSLRNRAKYYYVYQYVFNEASCLKIKRFDSLNKEWLEFIKENRSNGGTQHHYDVVIGPVADDDTMETVQLYMMGTITVNEAIERLRYSKVNNQISFHTKKALDYLKLVRREQYE